MISIIVPTYKRKQYIQSSIDSVLAQTYADWELLIVDDGSTDETVKICKAAAEKDSRIRVFTCTHHGVSAARNMGIKEARGKYIFFVDSDDLIHPCLLGELRRTIEIGSSTAASCMLKTVTDEDVENEEFYNFDLSQRVEEYYILGGEDLIRELLQSKQQTGAIGGKMFLKESIKGITFNHSIHKGEDTYFIYEYALNGGSLALCNAEWYYYRHHDSNSSALAKKQIDDDTFVQANTMMYENEKKRGNKENARLLKKHIFHNMKQMYESAKEQKNLNEAIDIRKRLFDLMINDTDKIASPKRWFSLVLLTCCYPLHKILKKLYRRR